MDIHVQKLINTAVILCPLLWNVNQVGIDADYEAKPIQKASETQLVQIIEFIKKTLPLMTQTLEAASYELAWKRAEENKQDEILFRKFEL